MSAAPKTNWKGGVPVPYFGPTWRLLAGILIVHALSTAHAQGAPPAEFPGVAEAVAAARNSDFGEGGPAMEYLRDRVLEVQLEPTGREELANTLAASLADPTSTLVWKTFVCRQLNVIGSEGQIDELTPLLHYPATAHLARYALEVIPGAEVNDLLWEAIAKADGPTAAGFATSLAARGGAATVMRLGELLAHPDQAVVTAALIGLGRIGGVEAERVLRKSFGSLAEEVHTEYYEALLACAEFYRAGGNGPDAIRLFDELMQAPLPLSVRLAGFEGTISVNGEAASPLVAAALTSGDAPWVRAALSHVRTLGGPNSTLLFAQQLGSVSQAVQAPLLQALADRGDPGALPYLSGGVNSQEVAVQYATLDALGALGNETSLPLLLAGLTSNDGEAVERSRRSLVRMPDAGTNGALVQSYERGDSALRAALAPVLAERQALEAIPALLLAAANQDGEARSNAFKALGDLARSEHQIDVVALFYDAEAEEERMEASRALANLCRRVAPSEERSVARAAIYAGAPTSLTRAGALQLFCDLGDNVLLPLVISACGDGDSVVQDAAVTALSTWPDATPIHEVYALATTGRTELHRMQALEGYIRLLRLPSERPESERLEGFRQALTLANNNVDILRSILAGLADLKIIEALDLAESFLENPEIHAEAAVAAEKIRSRFYALTASANGEAAALAADGNIDTAWKTPGPQEDGQWIEVDMSRPAEIRGLVLDSSRSSAAFPRAYRVQVYAKGAVPGAPAAEGAGNEGVTEINFPAAATGQILRVTLTGSAADTPWAIHELRIVPQ